MRPALAPGAGRVWPETGTSARLRKCKLPRLKRRIPILALLWPAFSLAGCSPQARQSGRPEPLPQAQPTNLLGRWQGYYDGAAITITFLADGQYSQLVQGPSVTTTQSGPYTLAAPNTVSLGVTDWTPRTEQVYQAVGASRGHWTSHPAPRPPECSDTYAFKGPNTLVLTDQPAQASITMKRLP
jgi:hypothetical protein